MGRVIAVANQKGGVGKTTTALNLGAALREQGYRILLVDMDPQASLTLACGFDPDQLEHTVYTPLREIVSTGQATSEVARLTTEEGLELVPSNIELSQAEVEFIADPLVGVYVFRHFIHPLTSDYDFVLVDCPPSLGILTMNVLAAAHYVIIPLQADYLALKGLELLLATVAKIQRLANPELRVMGVLLTMADLRTLHAREVIAITRQRLANRLPVFESVIKSSVRFKEAPVAGQSILTYAGDTAGAEAYRALAQELLTRLQEEET